MTNVTPLKTEKRVGVEATTGYLWNDSFGAEDYHMTNHEMKLADGTVLTHPSSPILDIQRDYLGDGARHLRLTGKPSKKDLHALMDRTHPKTGQFLGQRRDKNKVQVIGDDVTVAGPKSVAILGMVDTRLHEALERASMKHMLFDVQPLLTRRVRGAKDKKRLIEAGRKIFLNSKNTEVVKCGNAIIVPFFHTTSRPEKDPKTGELIPDPHPHIHNLIMNAVFDPDYVCRNGTKGGFLALDVNHLMKNGPLLSQAYLVRLAEEVRALGYEVRDRKDGDWEIDGISDVLCKKFSQRSERAKKVKEEHGLEGQEAFRISSRNRYPKAAVNKTTTQVREAWLARMTKEENDAVTRTYHEAVSRTVRNQTTAESGHAAHNLIDDVTVELFKDEDKVLGNIPLNAFLQEAYSRGGVNGVTKRDIDQEIQERKSGKWLFSEEAAGKQWLSVRRVSGYRVTSQVQSVRENLQSDKGTLPSIGALHGEWISERFRAPNLDTEDDEKAVIAVLSSRDRAVMLRCPPGPRRNRMTKEAVRQIERSGRTVHLCAQSAMGKASLLEVGLSGAALHGLLYDEAGRARVNRGDVLWIDEAGLVGVQEILEITVLAKERGARIVFSAGSFMEDPYHRSCPLSQLDSVMSVSALVEKDTARNKTFEAAKLALTLDKPLKTYALMFLNDEIVAVEPGASGVAMFASDYVTLSQKTNLDGHPNEVVARCDSSVDAERLTAAIRKNLRTRGDLGADHPRSTLAHGTEMAPSERASPRVYAARLAAGEHLEVRFTQNVASGESPRAGKPFFNAGGTFRVEAVKDGRVLVRGDAGTQASLPLGSPETFVVAAYRPQTTQLAAGDSIRITEPSRFPRVHPGKLASLPLGKDSVLRVLEIHEDGSVVAGRLNRRGVATQGRQVRIPADFQHISHAYLAPKQMTTAPDQVMVWLTKRALKSTRDLGILYDSIKQGREGIRVYCDDTRALVSRIRLEHPNAPDSEVLGLLRQDNAPAKRVEQWSEEEFKERRRRMRMASAHVSILAGKDPESLGLGAEELAYVKMHIPDEKRPEKRKKDQQAAQKEEGQK